MPSVGVIALMEFLRPLGLDGVVVLMRGRVGTGELGLSIEGVPDSIRFPIMSSSNASSSSVEGVAPIERVLRFFGIPLSGRTCLFFAPGGRPLRFKAVAGVLELDAFEAIIFVCPV